MSSKSQRRPLLQGESPDENNLIEDSPFRSPSRSPSQRSRRSDNGVAARHELSISPFYAFPLSFVNSFAWGLLDVPLVYLLRSEICVYMYSVNPNDDICRSVQVQQRVSILRACFEAIAAILGVFMISYYGVLGDTRGRRLSLGICASLVALGDAWIFIYLYLSIPPYFILLAAVFKGLGGFVSALVGGHNAFIADCTESAKRSEFLGINFAISNFGACLAPLLAGWLIEDLSRERFKRVFMISLSLWAAYLLYVLFVLPESKRDAVDDDDDSEASSSTSPSPDEYSLLHQLRTGYHNAFQPIRLILPNIFRSKRQRFPTINFDENDDGGSRRHRGMQLSFHALLNIQDTFIATMLIGLTLFAAGTQQLIPLYTDYQFQWDAMKTTSLMSGISVSTSIALMLFLPLVSKFTTMALKRWATKMSQSKGVVLRDVWIARVGYVLLTGFTLSAGLATTGSTLVASFLLQSFGNICIPALQSLALNAIRSEYNGRIMSAFAIMEGTAMVTRGPAFAAIYNLSVSRMPNLVFFVGAVRLWKF